MDKEYDPIGCDHKIPEGKYKGFSAFEFLSEESGSGPDFYYHHHLSVCRLCGEVKVGGFEADEKGVLHYYNRMFSLHYPDAVAAIVKYCNYMNKDSKEYQPFVKQSMLPTSVSETSHEPKEPVYQLTGKQIRELWAAACKTVIENIYDDFYNPNISVETYCKEQLNINL